MMFLEQKFLFNFLYYCYSNLLYIVSRGLRVSYLSLSYITHPITFLSFLDIGVQVRSDPPVPQQ